MVRADDVIKELEYLANPDDARFLQRYFKTGPGEYAQGDVFLGIRVPVLRKFAKNYGKVPLGVMEELLHCPYHEGRFVALLLMIKAYKNQDEQIYQLYLHNTSYINNWDLVDTSAPHIVGQYLWEKDPKPLLDMAESSLLWDRRIAIISTFNFIKKDSFNVTLEIVRVLLHDHHDLMHKAVGWMLREVGKRDLATEERFLQEYYHQMPRTMLRYAIEKFPEEMRQAYLQGAI